MLWGCVAARARAQEKGEQEEDSKMRAASHRTGRLRRGASILALLGRGVKSCYGADVRNATSRFQMA